MKSCWFHDWSKWEQYTAKMFLIENPATKIDQPMQKRTCLKCGYQEREEVGY